MPRTKTCPSCAEDVKAAAKVCRFCGHQFDIAAEKIAAGKTARNRGIFFVLAVGAVIVIANTGDKTPRTAERSTAENLSSQSSETEAPRDEVSERGGSILYRMLNQDRDQGGGAAAPSKANAEESQSLADTVVRVIRERRAEPQIEQSDERAIVEFMLDPWALTSGTARDAFVMMASDLVPLVFSEHEDIRLLTITGTGSFTDDRANEFRQEALSVTYSRENAASINWPNMISIGYERVLDLADETRAHPAFRR